MKLWEETGKSSMATAGVGVQASGEGNTGNNRRGSWRPLAHARPRAPRFGALRCARELNRWAARLVTR